MAVNQTLMHFRSQRRLQEETTAEGDIPDNQMMPSRTWIG